MSARELDRSVWPTYFDEISKRLEHENDLWAALAVTTDKVDGTEADSLPLNSITFEDGDDQIAIGLGGRGKRFPAVVWHFVDRPAHVWVREEGDVPASIGIEAGDGSYHFLDLRPGDGG